MSDVSLVLTGYKDGILSFAINKRTNRFEAVTFSPISTDETVDIGDIFVAKVLNVVPSIKAAFIDYQKGKKGYLSIDEKYEPIILNRKSDGRILAGDNILVQLEKEAVRSKEPVFTMNLSLAGRYSVVTNANLQKSVSKKCTKNEKNILSKAISDELKYGTVIRTSAANLIKDIASANHEIGDEVLKEILRPIVDECNELNVQMDKILTEGIHRTCYSRVYKAMPIYLANLLNDTQIDEYAQIITDDKYIYEELVKFMSAYMPGDVSKISFYSDDTYPLQKLYSVETKLDELLGKKVWLKSGAYLVIEKTEALYVIDVNSGKNITKKNAEQYAYNINIEAANEIMRQIKLRNLTGIILVDFINMNEKSNNEILIKELKALAKNDRIQTTIVDMTALGLIEITRQKNTKTLYEQIVH